MGREIGERFRDGDQPATRGGRRNWRQEIKTIHHAGARGVAGHGVRETVIRIGTLREKKKLWIQQRFWVVRDGLACP